MCGRFEIHSELDIVAKIFRIVMVSFGIKPNCNAKIKDLILAKA